MATQGVLRIPGTAPLTEPYKQLQSDLSALHELGGPDLVDALFPADCDWAADLRAAALSMPAESFSPAELLEWMIAMVNRQEAPLRANYVRVMSMHKAKGLTADLVVVAGCVEGMIPRDDAASVGAERQRKLEEQRRLFYVAMTRARQTLVLSSFTRLDHYHAHRMMPQVRSTWSGAGARSSRFMSELGPAAPASVTGDVFLRAVSLRQEGP